jgi:hypothetical protein
MALTPLAAGGAHLIAAWPLPAVAWTESGAPGTPTVDVTAVDGAEWPLVFEANTVTR